MIDQTVLIPQDSPISAWRRCRGRGTYMSQVVAAHGRITASPQL